MPCLTFSYERKIFELYIALVTEQQILVLSQYHAGNFTDGIL